MGWVLGRVAATIQRSPQPALGGLFCAHAVTQKSRLQNSVTVFVTANPLIYNDILAKNRGLQKLQDFLNNY